MESQPHVLPLHVSPAPQSAFVVQQSCVEHVHVLPLRVNGELHVKSHVPCAVQMDVPFCGGAQGVHVVELEQPVSGVLPWHEPLQKCSFAPHPVPVELELVAVDDAVEEATVVVVATVDDVTLVVVPAPPAPPEPVVTVVDSVDDDVSVVLEVVLEVVLAGLPLPAPSLRVPPGSVPPPPPRLPCAQPNDRKTSAPATTLQCTTTTRCLLLSPCYTKTVARLRSPPAIRRRNARRAAL